jgi:hypothetical protein
MTAPEDDAPTDEPSEEDEAAERDRAGGRQFGRVMMVLGACGVGAGLFLVEDQYLVGGGIALAVLGFVAHRWPVEIVRLLSGMSDKM